MTGSATAAARQALGAYGEGLAARHLVEQGMVLLDRNWRCDGGEIDLVLRDGRRAGRLRGEDPQRAGATARRSRRSTDAKARRGCAGWPARWLAEHDVRARTRCASTWSACSGRGAAASVVEHVRGVG